jgi:signal transduction histidine kinase
VTFRSAVLRLTSWYVGALVMVCLIFSIPIYNITSKRLAQGADRQGQIIERLPGVGPRVREAAPELRQARDRQLTADRTQLLKNLIIVNMLIIAAGAYLSYVFAKHTLRPLEEAHEAQSRFTADASHELRTPLATMQAEIEVALRDKKLTNNDARAVLESNLEEVKRLATLSNQLLNLTRLDANGLNLQPTQLSEAITKEVHAMEKQTGLKITKTIDQGIAIRADEHLIRQVVNILINNATRYSGSKPADISLSLQQSGNQAVLTVTDKGLGIAASDIPHIYERFYRGKNSVSGTGHGLGLSLAQEIINKHGGTIEAVSELGVGTTFKVTLPI